MRKKIASAIIFFLLIQTTIFSQNNHYWWQNFGGEATMMSGAVIAGVRDNSAVFYNPGAIGFIDDLTISVNANVYMAQITKIKNGAGDGLNLKQWRYTYFPQMISGMLPFKKLDKWRFGYTLMTRYKSYYRFNNVHAKKYDVTEAYPGEETYVGSYEYFNDMDEQWGGVGISYRVSEKFSMGITPFVSYRNQSFQQVVNARTIPVVDTNYFLISIGDYDNIRYINWKVLFKIGFALDLGKWKLGLTVTSPSMSIYGDADVQREISLVNFDKINPGISNADLLAIDRQESLGMHNKSPLSIGGGIRYEDNKTLFEISGEYFFGIKPYKMINTSGRPFIYPEQLVPDDFQSDFDFLAVYNYANPVMNVGLGIKHNFSETVDLLCGFHTDFNFKRKPEETPGYVVPTGTWDFYHFSSGINYNMKSSRITAGLNYYFGIENDMEQLINFTNPKDYLGLTGELGNNASVRIHGIAAVIGFTYFFQEKSSSPF